MFGQQAKIKRSHWCSSLLKSLLTIVQYTRDVYYKHFDAKPNCLIAQCGEDRRAAFPPESMIFLLCLQTHLSKVTT